MSTTINPLANHDESNDNSAPVAVGSDQWWQARSNAELKQFVELGLSGGKAFDQAAHELERRVRIESERSREKEAALEFHRLARRRKLDAANFAMIIVLLSILALAIYLRV